MVNVPDYEYYKSRGLFFLFGFYFFVTIILNVQKILEKNKDLKIKEETLKAKAEIRKYLENKNKKQ